MLRLFEQRAIRKGSIVEDGSDLVYPFSSFYFLMAITCVVEIVLNTAYKRIHEITKAARDAAAVTPSTYVDLLVDNRQLAFFRVYFFKDRRKRNPIPPNVDTERAADIGVLAVIACTEEAGIGSGRRIRDPTDRALEVARSLRAYVSSKQPVLDTVFEVP